MKKKCSKCGTLKSLNEFHVCSRTSTGRQSYCKLCNRKSVCAHRERNPEYEKERYLIREWNITPEEFQELNGAQDGRCAICGGGPSGKSRLHIDHCHKTGVIRGLLCYNCNDGLGRFKDNPHLLQIAISYLQKQKQEGEA